MTEPPEDRPKPEAPEPSAAAEPPRAPTPPPHAAPPPPPPPPPPPLAPPPPGSGWGDARGWVGTPGRAALVAVIATLVLAVVPCSIGAFLAGIAIGSVSTGDHHHWDERRHGPYDGPYPGPGPRIEKPRPGEPAPTKPLPSKVAPAPSAT
ncbi:hypothetical protein [Dactylosporangium sp. NPDC048998]|uniref:hypothetical protein n=1 Tax=Dactylosporangium sp. NPDC048998 TaxID=3363976 RepID=UPI003710B929